MSAKQQNGPAPLQRRKRRRPMRFLVGGFGIVFLVLLLGGILVGCSAVASAPDVTKLNWQSSTVLYDRNGQEIYRLHAGENRTPVKLNQIPKHVTDSFVAIEDPNFYNHFGIDPKGLARAVFRSALYYMHLPGGHLEGGSTITQQLARDAWLTQDVNVKRKVQEAWVAIQLERTYTKDEILEMYLNQIYFGEGAYGIEAAAHTFFGKEVKDLTIAEGAQLAGMVNGPSYFDPYEHMDASVQRRNLVLDALLKQNDISDKEYAQAKAEQPKLDRKSTADSVVAGSFTDYVINALQQGKPGLAEKYGLKLGDAGSVAKAGLKVTTTLDPKLQQLAEKAVSDQMTAADKEYGTGGKAARPEAAMVVMNPKTGEVLAMVGGREHKAMLEFNRATDALRQPGSSIKPFVAYMPALEAGLSPGTILDDAPVMLTQDKTTVWPQNYDFRYEGLKPMRYGVEQSINPMAVRAMIAAGGPTKAADYARKFGLTTIGKDDENLALALGGISQGTTLLDMTSAYSALDNMGTKVDPVIITKIVDASGNTVFQAQPHKEQVVKPTTAYLMLDMMKDVIRKGTAYGFTGGFHGWPAAGKTGTTENNRDAWFAGMTPDLVTVVWNGYDNPDNHLPWTGAFVPVKIWNQFMNQAVPQKPADWARPSGISTVTICKATGMLPSDACPANQVGPELFAAGTEPKTAGDILVKAQAVQVAVQSADKKTTTTEWELWQPGCPAVPVTKTFIKRPQPRVLHPTDPYNPKYVPQDAKDELPTKVCTLGSWWNQLLPSLPKLPFLPGSGTTTDPGAQQPAPTTPAPGTTAPGTAPGTTAPGTQPVVPGTGWYDPTPAPAYPNG